MSLRNLFSARDMTEGTPWKRIAEFAFPMLLGLSLVSRELILVTITEKWIESAKMLQILCLWGAFIPIQSLFTNLLISRRRSRVYMWSTIVQGTLLTVMLLVLRPYGITNMIVAYVLLNFAWLFVWQHFVNREISFTLTMMLRDTLPYFALSAAVMYATAILTDGIENIYTLLLTRIAVAAALYIIALLIVRSTELRELAAYIISRKTQSNG